MAYNTRNNISEQQHNNANQQTATAQFADNRTSAAIQLKQQTLMATSPTATAQRAAVKAMNTSEVQQQKTIQRAAPKEELQMKSIHHTAQLASAGEGLLQDTFATAQRMDDEELLQGNFETTQRVEDEELLQGKFETAQRAEDEELLQGKFEPAQRAEKPNNTGLPDNLKSGIENLSGMSMNHVKVHYNSDKPAQLQAHAYAQGSDIHVAPGQEKHLPHEAWHVVQQAQGRVKPTMQMKGGVPVNDDVGLEAEADVMGEKANTIGANVTQKVSKNLVSNSQLPPIQRLTADGTDYTPDEIAAAAQHAKIDITKKKPKDTDFAASMATHLQTNAGGLGTKYRDLASLTKACKGWWNKPSSYEVVAPVAVRTALVAPTITYGAVHGDLHFIATPTTKKSAWTLDKTAALALMVTEINKHLVALGTHSAAHENAQGWSGFYVTGVHTGAVGRYKVSGQRENPETSHFSIQLQVHYASNTISYHGYPDEAIENSTLGCSATKMGAKLT